MTLYSAKALVLVAALGVSAPVAAQADALAVSAGQTRLTSPDGFTMPTVGASYERALTPWLGLSVEAGVAPAPTPPGSS